MKIPFPYICRGRKSDRDFETPPDTFSYYMEDITRTLVDDGGTLVYQNVRCQSPPFRTRLNARLDSRTTRTRIQFCAVSIVKERYDFKNKRSAQGFIDHTVTWTRPLFFSKNAKVNVHDFKQGVAYTVDQRCAKYAQFDD